MNASATAGSPGRRPRRGPGGGLTASKEAAATAAGVLEVLAGLRTPEEAASALGISAARYYQLEARALKGLVAACEPPPRGRTPSAARQTERLARENERLRQECQRQQALVRLARQAAGLGPPAAGGAKGSAKRRKRKTARGQQAAACLRQEARAASAGPDAEASG